MHNPPLFAERFWPLTTNAKTAHSIALWAENRSLTYQQLGDRVKARCAHYEDNNLKRGARIVLLQERTLDMCVDLVAALCAGLSVTILSRAESIDVSVAKIKTINADLLIADNNNLDRAEKIAGQTGTPVQLRHDYDNKQACPDPTPNPTTIPQPTIPDGDDEALIIFTSGTTGAPKGIALSQGNIASNTYGLLQKMPVYPSDHYLHVMPMSHTNGVLNQICLPLGVGARVTLLSHFKAEPFMDALSEYKPTIFTAVPTILSRLLDFDIPKDVSDNLRFIRCGSAQLLPELHRRAESHFGVEVLVSYGQTEITCTNTTNLPSNRKIGSVGVVLPLQELAILNTDNDSQMNTGDVGEVCFRGANVATEIIGIRPLDKTAWFRTGDCGYVDGDGYLFLTGRLKDIIIRGGSNLSPQQIENTLLYHHGVKSASVVGIPHPDLGEVPVACIEPSGTQPLTLAELNTIVTEKLSSSHQLDDYFTFDVFPQNETGKVDKKALLNQVLEKINTP